MRMHKTQIRILHTLSERSLNGLTLRGIGDIIGVSHAMEVSHHLIQLEKKGLVRRNKGTRTIERVGPGMGKVGNVPVIRIPILNVEGVKQLIRRQGA